MDKEDKKEIVGMFEHISEKMATKEDLVKLETKMEDFRNETSENFKEVRNDISSLRTDLSLVEEKTENNTGFAEEIDTLFDEVKMIKKHVGLKESF